MFVGLLHEFDPGEAAVLGIIGPRAFVAKAGVVDFISGDKKIVDAAGGRDRVVVHGKDQLQRLGIAHAAHVVTAVGSQGGEFRVLQHVRHVRRRLNFGNDLDVAFQCVVHQFLQFARGIGAGSADRWMRRVFEFVLEFEADHVHFEARRPIEIALESFHAVLVVLGVPVQNSKLQLRPILDRPLR